MLLAFISIRLVKGDAVPALMQGANHAAIISGCTIPIS
jgi:hypothetical protein